MQLQEKDVPVAGHVIKLREMTTEIESLIKSKSQTFNPKKKMMEMDQPSLDANMIFYSVVPETWPTSDFGPLTVENIKKLPTKISRRLLREAQSLNVLEEDVADFLDTQSKSTPSTQTTS